MDLAGLSTAAICGVSYGGLIAARLPRAIRSGSSPRARLGDSAALGPNARVRFYLRAPRLLSPLFLIGSLRMYPGDRGGEVRRPTGYGHCHPSRPNALTHMFSPARMARRVRLAGAMQARP